MSGDAKFVYHEQGLRYRFNDQHPFNQKRIVLLMDMMRKAGLLDDSMLLTHRAAEEDELLLAHAKPYVDAVKALSLPSPSAEVIREAERYGLDTSEEQEDTPFFEHMHEATCRLVGGSIAAAELVMSGQAPPRFPSGRRPAPRAARERVGLLRLQRRVRRH